MKKEKKQLKELSEDELKKVTGGTIYVTGVPETDAVRARYSVLFTGNPKETETDGIETIYD